MAYPRREQFDRNRDFTAAVPLTIAGESIISGHAIDKAKLSTRTLRQLYEQRRLTMGGPSHQAKQQQGPARPNFASLPDGAILSWLSARGIIPHPRTTREELVVKANSKWDQLQSPQSKDIPQEWLKLGWFELQKKVGELVGRKPKNKADLIKMMREARQGGSTEAEAA